MKYIEIYLNERKKELEKLKKEEIEKFKNGYQNCLNDDDIENLMEDVFFDYYNTIDSCNMRLQEIENLRNDLVPKDNKDNLESQV